MKSLFVGTQRLTRFILRRERLSSAVWLAALLGFILPLVPGMANMFDGQARQALAVTLDNPAMIAMMGPVFGAQNYTVGAMYAGTMLLWTAIAVAIMNIFLVIRHTRADEELGRIELLRSLPVGRLADLSAAMTVAVLINLTLGLLTGLGMAAMGEPTMPFHSCMLYGAALSAIGLFFAAVAALFAQLSSSSRGAMGYSFLALGLLYVLRAAGDVAGNALSYISALGLMQRARPFVENHWWPVLLILLQTAALTAIAFALSANRDLGRGLLHARRGRSEARPWLRTPFGLALRLQGGTLLIWAAAIFALGASYGSVLGNIETFVADSPLYQQAIGLNDQYTVPMRFTSMVNVMMALLAAAPLLIAVLKPYAEEKMGRAENVLARAVSRHAYLCGYVTLAFAASLVLQLANALGLYISAAAVLAEPIPLLFLVKANLVFLPALWVMMGLAVLLIGLWPRASAAVWAYFAFAFFTTFVGRMLTLPTWLRALTPYHYIPQLPMDGIRILPLLALCVITLILTTAGFVLYRKRDLLQ